jgi:hypothetical protein
VEIFDDDDNDLLMVLGKNIHYRYRGILKHQISLHAYYLVKKILNKDKATQILCILKDIALNMKIV